MAKGKNTETEGISIESFEGKSVQFRSKGATYLEGTLIKADEKGYILLSSEGEYHFYSHATGIEIKVASKVKLGKNIEYAKATPPFDGSKTSFIESDEEGQK